MLWLEFGVTKSTIIDVAQLHSANKQSSCSLNTCHSDDYVEILCRSTDTVALSISLTSSWALHSFLVLTLMCRQCHGCLIQCQVGLVLISYPFSLDLYLSLQRLYMVVPWHKGMYFSKRAFRRCRGPIYKPLMLSIRCHQNTVVIENPEDVLNDSYYYANFIS